MCSQRKSGTCFPQYVQCPKLVVSQLRRKTDAADWGGCQECLDLLGYLPRTCALHVGRWLVYCVGKGFSTDILKTLLRKVTNLVSVKERGPLGYKHLP